MWGTILSDPLAIIALVGRYPSSQLMARMPLRPRVSTLPAPPCGNTGSCGITPPFDGLPPCAGQVAYALRTRAPVAISVSLRHAAPRLACVRPAASVHPEPGSNSPLSRFLFLYSVLFRTRPLILLPFPVSRCHRVNELRYSAGGSNPPLLRLQIYHLPQFHPNFFTPFLHLFKIKFILDV